MAHKTFISYKYSEARDLRDRIVDALGDDATYYQGETADSPDLTDEATSTIKATLTDMMYSTSVTIVILSPGIKSSKWIDWEISYCLKEFSRKGRTSRTNGLVCVVQKVDGSCDWLVTKQRRRCGCCVRIIDHRMLYSIINSNRYNVTKLSSECSHCRAYDGLADSYMSIIDEDDFLAEPQRYIDNAFEKSENSAKFTLRKQRSS